MAIVPRVFTIPASVPFLPTVARALIDGKLVEGFSGSDPLALAQATIYLPTRRACRLARDAFFAASGTDAAVLPRIVALGDIDEDELIFAEAGTPEALALPPAIAGFERRTWLARLILQWAGQIEPRPGEPALVVNSPSAALALADDLARLMDDFTTRQVSWDKLDDLVRDKSAELDKYWQLTLKFLQVARDGWPQILTERGAIEPAERRDLLIAAEGKRLASATAGPVIAAGSTGSMPATAELLATIARLPHGAVVLPGLDTHLDDDAWALIGGKHDKADKTEPAPSHPQFAMHALLGRLGIARRDVATLAAPAPHGREKLVSEALRPAEASDAWREQLSDLFAASQIAAGMDGLSVIEAANAEEEALAIAVALREAVEDGRTTAALVTPDRALARRVAAALARWQIVPDDSGGDQLAATPAGVFARLVAEVALNGLAPVPLLALLKHPLLRLGAGSGAQYAAVAALERAVLRGPRPRRGSRGLADALSSTRREWDKFKQKKPSELHWSDPAASLRAADFDMAADLVAKLAAALAPLERLDDARHSLTALAERHRDAIVVLSTDHDGDVAAFAAQDGTALAMAFEELLGTPAPAAIALARSDYTEAFLAAISARVVRRPETPGARVSIYGLLEARLTDSDRVVLGGLAEGVWPPEARSDPWLSRPMRRELGLDLPERRIGLTAHDFAQLLGARDVVLTRATRIAGAPTVASRFLQRLAAVAGETRWKAACERGDRYLTWARTLDRPDGAQRPILRPEPKPPRAARPASLSVTEIEALLRDPYEIYAKHVLRLRPLDMVDTPPGARDRGTVIHGAIGDFTQMFAAGLPPNAYEELVKLGEAHFAALNDYPEARAFWWPRFLRIARWFADWEATRRSNAATVIAEVSATMPIALGERSFTLRTRADRIERLTDGRYAILDYKTGRVPTATQVREGLSPQLTLEGAMLRGGHFANIPAGGSIAEFAYVSVRGMNPAGEEKAIGWDDTGPDAQSDRALQRLADVLRKFEDHETYGYLSKERAMFMRRADGDYDHLARIREWAIVGDFNESAEGE